MPAHLSPTSPLPASVVKGILKQHTVILGKTRAGKSSVARTFVEQLLEREEPVCIVDPKGDWWGLKLAADGRRAGYPVVMFGNSEHADVPITAHVGAQVAELFATGNRPSLIDLGGWTVADRTRFWCDFAETLFRHTTGHRWLVVDEVHNFAPKGSLKGTDGHMAKALHWSNRLASEGLGKGLALLVASQRPQKVHNDLLTSCETLIGMRVLHPSDRQAVSDWMAAVGDAKGDEVLATLADLQRGEAWVWSPEIRYGPERIQFPMFATYDSFRPQQPGDAKRLKGWAEVDLNDVRAKLATVVEQAKQNDPRELKREIANLRQELARSSKQVAPMPAHVVPTVIEHHVLKDGQLARLEKLETAIGQLSLRINETAASLGTIWKDVRDRLAVITEAKRLEPVPPIIRDRDAHRANRIAWLHHAVPDRVTRPAPDRTGETDPQPTSGVDERILGALIEFEQLGAMQPTRELVCFMARYGNIRSKGFSNALGSLRSRRFIDYPTSGTIALTPEGRKHAPYRERPTTPAELQRRVMEILDGVHVKILEPLIKVYPAEVQREHLAQAAGYENTRSKGFANALGRLRTLGFVEYPNTGTVQASPVLFLEGL